MEDSFDKQLIRKTREATMTATSITDNFNNNTTNTSALGKNISLHQDSNNLPTNIKYVFRRNYFIRNYRKYYNNDPLFYNRQLSRVVNANVIDAICQCLLVQAVDSETLEEISGSSATQNILEEFACCLQDIINFKVMDKDKKTSA